jgi:glycosyltransferase involved in cell wall biosynthesis
MAAGVPVVAGAQGGPLEILRDSEDGRLVPPGDPIALAGAVADLLADPAARLRLARAARVKVEAEYAQPAYLARILALYGTLNQIARNSSPMV